MITIPTWFAVILLGIFPVYFIIDRIWTTFDNWLKEITIKEKSKNPIGFGK